MKLDNLISIFKAFKTQDDIEIFWNLHYHEIENCLFSINHDDIIINRLALIEVYEELEKSEPIKSILFQGEPLIEATKQLIFLFANILSKFGIYYPLFSLKGLLPDSSIGLRIKAATLYYRINNKQKEYVEKTIAILNLLQEAQYFEETDFTFEIISDFVNFYNTVQSKLSGDRYKEALLNFNKQFEDNNLIERFLFLQHPSIIRFLNGHAFDKIGIAKYPKKIFLPSNELQAELKRLVIDTVMRNKDWNRDTYYGISRIEILERALERGRGDFRIGYKLITPEEKVLLYCFFNLKKHYCTSYFIFEKLEKLLDYLADEGFRTLMIDLGCGPLTSGLALGDYFYKKTGKPCLFNYAGIDIAQPMLTQAKVFSDLYCFNENCNFRFELSWDELYDFIGKNINGNNLILINASYLFASNSLDIHNLAKFVSNIIKLYPKNHVYFIYQNSTIEVRNTKYEDFKKLIPQLHLRHSDEEIVKYQTQPGNLGSLTSEKIKFEILSTI